MAHDCERCAHRMICEWCVENSTFRMPQQSGKCDMFLQEVHTGKPSKEDFKTYRSMNIKAWITLSAYAAAMFIYPFAAKTVYGFPIWVLGWISCMIGWWCMAGSQYALIQALNDKIKEWEDEYGNEGNRGP